MGKGASEGCLKMPLNTEKLEKQLNGLKSYRDMHGQLRERVKKVLMTIYLKSGATTSELKQMKLMGTPLLHRGINWLEKLWLILHESVRSGGRGRPRVVYTLTEKGESALIFLSVPETESLKLRVDGRVEGEVEIRIPIRMRNGKPNETKWGSQQLNAAQLASLFRLVVTNPQFLSALFPTEGIGTPLTEWRPRSNPELEMLEGEIWSYCNKRIINDLNLEEAKLEVLEDKIRSFCGKEVTRDLNLKKRNLGKNTAERLEESKRIAQKVLGPCDSLRLPDQFLEDFTHDPDLELAKRAYQNYWKKRLDEMSAPELLPNWARLLQKKKRCTRRERKLIRQRRELIERRLKVNPNYAVPSPLWAELGFDAPREWNGEVSFPYNATISEPSSAQVVFSMILPFRLMAHRNVEYIRWASRINAENAGSPIRTIDGGFSSFLDVLKQCQENKDKAKDFYDAWGMLRELSIPSKDMGKICMKDQDFFGPIERAALRYLKVGKLVDLVRVYSDLGDEKLKTFEDAEEAIDYGRYNYKPQNRPSDSSCQGLTASGDLLPR